MAKELPYFKFEPAEWEAGNIQMCNREMKGAFIDLCSIYWLRLGDMPLRLAKSKIGEDLINGLDDLDIINVENDNVFISFLDEQISEFKDKSVSASKNASSRWDKIPERIKGQQVYVIECIGNSEHFIKIGETSTSINRRFSGKIPYKYKALVVDINSNCEVEYLYCQIANGCEYKPKLDFNGSLECYEIGVWSKIMEFAISRNAVFVHRNAIREDKIRVKKSKEEKNNVRIPELSEVLYHSESKCKELGLVYDKAKITVKFQSWVENGWKDGNNNKIVNWKSKINNTIVHILAKSKEGMKVEDKDKPLHEQVHANQMSYEQLLGADPISKGIHAGKYWNSYKQELSDVPLIKTNPNYENI